jgi:glycine betaine catabolism B
LSDEFVNVANAKDIQPSQMKAVEVNGEKVCLANVKGKYYAIGNVCTHLGGPLAEGNLKVMRFNVRGTDLDLILELA